MHFAKGWGLKRKKKTYKEMPGALYPEKMPHGSFP